MKLLFISNSSWNIYNFRSEIIKFYLSKRYSITIVSPQDNYTKKLNTLGCKIINIYLKKNKISLLADLIYFIKIVIIFYKEKPDYILSFTVKPNIYASIACRFLNQKIINNISGLGTTFLQGVFTGFMIRLLYKISLKKTYKVLFQNKDDLELFNKNNIVLRNNSHLLPGSGIDLDLFKNKSEQNQLKDNIIFLFFGRLLIDKGIFEFIDSARIIKKKYPNIQFNILGFIDEYNPRSIKNSQIKFWIDEGIINYFGETENVIPFIKKSDCIVLPSYREGLPKSLLEAAALSKPLIATNVPGCKDIVKNNVNGFLCEPHSSKSLCEAINNFINLSYDDRIKAKIVHGYKWDKKQKCWLYPLDSDSFKALTAMFPSAGVTENVNVQLKRLSDKYENYAKIKTDAFNVGKFSDVNLMTISNMSHMTCFH